MLNLTDSQQEGFRPLIRGFFFYKYYDGYVAKAFYCMFPSPHSGILFLYAEFKGYMRSKHQLFPSPHSGILFLFEESAEEKERKRLMFPSPHSGILFLSQDSSGIYG